MNGGQRVLVYGTALLSVMGVACILPVLPLLADYFGISDSALGVLIASFTLPGIFLTPLWGMLSDHLGRRRALIPCLLLFAAGGAGCLLATTKGQILFSRVVQGVGAAGLGTLFNTLVGDLCPEKDERLKELGRTMMLVAAGGALFPAIGGLLGEVHLKAPFLPSLLALPLACIAFSSHLPEGHIEERSLSAYAREAADTLRDPRNLRLFGVSFIIFGILYGPIITYFPLLAHANYGATPPQIGLIYAASLCGIAVGAIGTPKFSARLAPRTPALFAALLFCASMLLMLCIDALWYAVLPLLCYGLGQGLLYPSTMSALAGDARSTRSIVLAANATSVRLSQSLMPNVCGALFALRHFEGVYLFGFGMACLLFFLAPRSPLSGRKGG